MEHLRTGQKGFGTVSWLLLILVAVVIGLAGWFVLQKDNINQPSTSNSPSSSNDGQPATSFATPKKGAHFESSTPAHASTLPAVPANVVIDFNFDLADNSTIRIVKDGKDYGVGNTTIDSNKLAMRRSMDKTAPDGVYTVEYNGCWPDRTCHDGHFQFAIDTKLQDSYRNMRGQSAVTINMSELMFKPMNIIISQGTKVTWVNDDTQQHYVNTDSHPAHTHVPGLNSKALAKGASYSFTFSETGAYPYHCSAHAAQMTGMVVVT